MTFNSETKFTQLAHFPKGVTVSEGLTVNERIHFVSGSKFVNLMFNDDQMVISSNAGLDVKVSTNLRVSGDLFVSDNLHISGNFFIDGTSKSLFIL